MCTGISSPPCPLPGPSEERVAALLSPNEERVTEVGVNGRAHGEQALARVAVLTACTNAAA